MSKQKKFEKISITYAKLLVPFPYLQYKIRGKLSLKKEEIENL